MKNVSKVVVGMLIVALSFSSVFAAGQKESASSPADSDKIVLRIAWWGNQLRNDITQKVINMYMEQHPDVTIEAEFTDWSGYWDKLATQAAGGGLPDIIQMDYSYLLQYSNSNQLANLNDYISSGVINTSRIADAVVKSGSVEGSTYAIALGSTAPMMMYDQATIDKAGVKIPINPTVTEFYNLSQTIYEQTGIPMFWESGMNQILYVARGVGSEIFSDLSKGISKSSAAHFELVEKFANAPFHISPELLAEKNTLVVDQMPINDLTTWNQFTVSNGFSAIYQAAGSRPMGVCMYPKLDNAVKEPVYVKPTMFFSVSDTSEHKDAAAAFIDFFVNSMEANSILKGERGIPVNSEVATAVKSDVNQVDAVAYNYLAEVNKVATPVDPPNPPGFSEVEALLLTYVDRIRYGIMTADQATKEFVPKAQAILANATI
nr:ABC transporter substrate-binding protein [uncultured Sphaerochaeta sp.]